MQDEKLYITNIVVYAGNIISPEEYNFRPKFNNQTPDGYVNWLKKKYPQSEIVRRGDIVEFEHVGWHYRARLSPEGNDLRIEGKFRNEAKRGQDELLEAVNSALMPVKAKPTEPERDAPLTVWFDYYEAMKKGGWAITLKDIATKTNKTPGYIRQEHAQYKSGPASIGKKAKRRPNKKRTST